MQCFFFHFIFPPFLSIIYTDNLLCLFVSETGGRILFLFYTLVGGTDRMGGVGSAWGFRYIGSF